MSNIGEIWPRASAPSVAPRPVLGDFISLVGEVIDVIVTFDPSDRSIQPHPKLLAAFKTNVAATQVFDRLAPSRQREIVRYIDGLKSEESVDHNVQRALDFLLGKGRFVGRDKP